MKIAVTGGTGFIGQYLLRKADAEHEFVVLTARDPREDWVKSPYITYVKGEYNYDSFLKLTGGVRSRCTFRCNAPICGS